MTVCCGYVLPIVGTIYFAIFFFTLVGLFWGVKYNSDKYPEVTVTPFGQNYGSENASAITIAQPCYYPVFTTNATGTESCNVTVPGDFYCPKDYACVFDVKLFVTTPYVGCVSLNFSCGNLSTCIDLIEDLPDRDEYSKTLYLEYSASLLRLFAFVGVFFIILNVLVIVARVIFRARVTNFSTTYTIITNVILVVGFVLVVIIGGFFFSMDIITDGGDCYSIDSLDSAINTIAGIYIGYMEIYILGTIGAGAVIYISLIGVVMAAYLILKSRKNQENSPSFDSNTPSEVTIEETTGNLQTAEEDTKSVV